MSEYWHLRCNDCDLTSDDGRNHGDEMLLDMLLRRVAIASVMEHDSKFGGCHGYPIEFYFIRDHCRHNILIVSEYHSRACCDPEPEYYI